MDSIGRILAAEADRAFPNDASELQWYGPNVREWEYRSNCPLSQHWLVPLAAHIQRRWDREQAEAHKEAKREKKRRAREKELDRWELKMHKKRMRELESAWSKPTIPVDMEKLWRLYHTQGEDAAQRYLFRESLLRSRANR